MTWPLDFSRLPLNPLPHLPFLSVFVSLEALPSPLHSSSYSQARSSSNLWSFLPILLSLLFSQDHLSYIQHTTETSSQDPDKSNSRINEHINHLLLLWDALFHTLVFPPCPLLSHTCVLSFPLPLISSFPLLPSSPWLWSKHCLLSFAGEACRQSAAVPRQVQRWIKRFTKEPELRYLISQ